MSGIDEIPDEVFEDIAYLSRSRNRVRILRTLVSESASPRAVRDRTGTSKTTCNRILNELSERSWARQTHDGGYEATPQAEHVLVQFRQFVGSMSTLRSLADDVAVVPAGELTWGPNGELTLGLHHFDDADVKRKRPQQQGVGRAEIADAFRSTDRIHSVSDGVPPRIVGEVLQDRARRGELSGTVVFTMELFEYVRTHHDGPPDWADLIECGFEMYRYDGSTPDNLTVTDDTTFLYGETNSGTYGVVISRNDAVRTWGLDVVNRYRDRAQRVDVTAFD